MDKKVIEEKSKSYWNTLLTKIDENPRVSTIIAFVAGVLAVVFKEFLLVAVITIALVVAVLYFIEYKKDTSGSSSTDSNKDKENKTSTDNSDRDNSRSTNGIHVSQRE